MRLIERETAAPSLERLLDAIHDMAQPLTTMMFVLEMGRLQSRPEALKASLDTATEECRRAIAALDAVRGAADAFCPLPEGDPCL